MPSRFPVPGYVPTALLLTTGSYFLLSSLMLQDIRLVFFPFKIFLQNFYKKIMPFVKFKIAKVVSFRTLFENRVLISH